MRSSIRVACSLAIYAKRIHESMSDSIRDQFIFVNKCRESVVHLIRSLNCSVVYRL